MAVGEPAEEPGDPDDPDPADSDPVGGEVLPLLSPDDPSDDPSDDPLWVCGGLVGGGLLGGGLLGGGLLGGADVLVLVLG